MALVATLTMLLAGLTGVASAGERADCKGSGNAQYKSCEGLDPAATNCAKDATTIMRYGVRNEGGTYGDIELRYSKKCHSNWNRFSAETGARSVIQAWMQMGVSHARPWIWRPGTAPRGTANKAYGALGASYWTQMITADGVACASVDVVTQDPPDSKNPYSAGGGSVSQTFNAPCVS